jgi:hypothetical protein
VFLVANIFSMTRDHRFPHRKRRAGKAKPDPILAANQKGRILRRKERRRFLFKGKETENKKSRAARTTKRKNPRRERETRASIERSHKAREESLVFSLQREVNREDRARERDPALRVYIYFVLTTCVNKKEEFGKIFPPLFCFFFSVFFLLLSVVVRPCPPSVRVDGCRSFSLFSLSSLSLFYLSSLSLSLSRRDV